MSRLLAVYLKQDARSDITGRHVGPCVPAFTFPRVGGAQVVRCLCHSHHGLPLLVTSVVFSTLQVLDASQRRTCLPA